MSERLIEIVIPTYNRCFDLSLNLNKIVELLKKENLLNQVGIFVSDNGSPDQTSDMLQKFAVTHGATLNFNFDCLPENMGLEANAVNALSKATAPYVMWLGDDDFLPDGYLSWCVEQLQQKNPPGVIYTGAVNVFADGTVLDVRKTDQDLYTLPAGFETFRRWSYLGHCMSGTLIKREGALNDYLKNEDLRNPYIFLYLAANRLLKYGGFYVPRFKVEVNMVNAKDWSYDETGLLSELFKCYYPFIDELGEEQVAEAIAEVSKKNASRFCIEILKPFKSVQRYRRLLQKMRLIDGLKWKMHIVFLKHIAYSIWLGKFRVADYIRNNS